jgi:hypothetical protein
MSDSPNVSAVRRLYKARGNPEGIRQVLASRKLGARQRGYVSFDCLCR